MAAPRITPQNDKHRVSPPASARPSAPRRRALAHAHKKKLGWPIWVMFSTFAFALLLLVLHLCNAGSYYREEASAQHWLLKAEREFGAKDFASAMDSCKLAALRAEDDATRQSVQALHRRIEEQLVRQHDQASLDLALRSMQAIEDFQAKHMAVTPSRPAVRELTRIAQNWLQRHGEVARRYPDTAPLASQVQALCSVYGPQARLDRPDDAADVLFSVERRLSVAHPLYREVLGSIDGYVAAHPNDSHNEDLRARRAGIVDAARADFDRHEAEARRLLAARRIAEAHKEVQAMRDAIVVNAWEPLATAVENEILRAEK